MSYRLDIQDLTRDTVVLTASALTKWPPTPTWESLRQQAPEWADLPTAELTQSVLRAVKSLELPHGEVVAVQSWQGSLRGDGESAFIDWQEGPGLKPPRFSVSADLDGFYLWGEHGEGLSLEDEVLNTPAAMALAKALHAWAWFYDQACAACKSVKADMRMDWDQFNQTGMALAEMVKALLGESAVVFYEKAAWDATRAVDEIRLVE